MEKRHPLLKVMVIVVALLLASSFIAYHAGAFDQLLGSSKPPPRHEQPEPKMMHGTKY